MSLPTTQKAIVIHENGGPEVLKYEDIPVPQIKDSEILIKNKYAGINFIESYFRTGLYKSTKPYILGREASGVIVAIGSQVTNYKIGDNVAYLSASTFAQYTAVSAENGKILKLPQDIDEEAFKIYGSVLIQALTALTFITESYNVLKDDYVLVHAAAGGVGLILDQLISLRGAHVIGTVSTPEKAKLAKENGAEYIINYTNEDTVSKVLELTNGNGVAAVFDGVGKTTFDISLESVARKGTVISFGNASGAVEPVSLFKLTKNLKLLRPGLFSYIVTKEEWNHYSQELNKLIVEKILKFDIKVFELKDYRTATELLEGRKTTGKLTLKIPQ